MRKLAIVLTSAVLAFSAVGCQAWGSSSNCCKKCCKKSCCMKGKCHKCCRRGR